MRDHRLAAHQRLKALLKLLRSFSLLAHRHGSPFSPVTPAAVAERNHIAGNSGKLCRLPDGTRFRIMRRLFLEDDNPIGTPSMLAEGSDGRSAVEQRHGIRWPGCRIWKLVSPCRRPRSEPTPCHNVGFPRTARAGQRAPWLAIEIEADLFATSGSEGSVRADRAAPLILPLGRPGVGAPRNRNHLGKPRNRSRRR